MPELIPFCNLHYKVGEWDGEKLKKLVAPPYDVISREEENELKKDPDNICNVILPGQNYVQAGKKLDELIESGKLTCNDERCICIYGIDYKRPDTGEEISRYGFVGLLKLVEIFPAHDGIIPHEMTFRKYTEDRLNLIRETDANFSPIFTIYNGTNGTAEKIFKKYIDQKPFLQVVDRDNFTHKIWEIKDKEDIKEIQEIIRTHQVIIADGHHRYITSLRHSKHGGCKYIMTLFIDFNDLGLIIYTTHREIRKIPVKNVEDFKQRVKNNFLVEAVKDFKTLQDKMNDNQGKHVFGCYYKKHFLFLKLKDSIRPEDMIDGIHSDAWKNLNIPILHDILLKESLNVNENDVDFIKDVKKGLKNVDNGKIEALFMLNPTTLEEIQIITRLKEIMPQKSTYFYPKPLSGLIIHKHSDKAEYY